MIVIAYPDKKPGCRFAPFAFCNFAYLLIIAYLPFAILLIYLSLPTCLLQFCLFTY